MSEDQIVFRDDNRLIFILACIRHIAYVNKRQGARAARSLVRSLAHTRKNQNVSHSSRFDVIHAENIKGNMRA